MSATAPERNRRARLVAVSIGLSWATLAIVGWSSNALSFLDDWFAESTAYETDAVWTLQLPPNSTQCPDVITRSAFVSVSKASRTQSAPRCALRDWTTGEWELAVDVEKVLRETGLNMTYSDIYNPDFNKSAVRRPWAWTWRPESSSCQNLPPFSPERLCSVLGQRSILFVGDSLQANMIAAFRNQLDAGETTRRCTNRDWSLEYQQNVVICPSGARLDYIRNDHLSLIDREDMDCRDRCFPWIQAIHEYDFLILNTGLHILDIDRFQFVTHQTVEYLRRHYNGTVIYRLASAGHEKCMTYTRPWKRAEYEERAAVFQEKPYRWHFVEAYNDIAWRWYSTLTDAVILDTDAIVRLRPDVHRSEGDCLHHVIPGAWDYAVLMLYYVIVGELR